MARKLVIVKEKLVSATPYSVAVLMVLSLVVFQIMSLILHNLFGFTMVKVGVGFLLMLVAAVTILPHAIIMGDLKLSSKEIWLLIIVIGIDILIITNIGPKYVPSMFSSMQVVWP